MTYLSFATRIILGSVDEVSVHAECSWRKGQDFLWMGRRLAKQSNPLAKNIGLLVNGWPVGQNLIIGEWVMTGPDRKTLRRDRLLAPSLIDDPLSRRIAAASYFFFSFQKNNVHKMRFWRSEFAQLHKVHSRQSQAQIKTTLRGWEMNAVPLRFAGKCG